MIRSLVRILLGVCGTLIPVKQPQKVCYVMCYCFGDENKPKLIGNVITGASSGGNNMAGRLVTNQLAGSVMEGNHACIITLLYIPWLADHRLYNRGTRGRPRPPPTLVMVVECLA